MVGEDAREIMRTAQLEEGAPAYCLLPTAFCSLRRAVEIEMIEKIEREESKTPDYCIVPFGRYLTILAGLCLLAALADAILGSRVSRFVAAQVSLDGELSPTRLLRAHLIFGFSALALLLYAASLKIPRFSFKARAPVWLLIIGIGILLLVWMFDKAEFISEESIIARYTSSALILAGLAALANLFIYSRLYEGEDRFKLQMFWLLAGAAMIWASCDELLMFHERIGAALGQMSHRGSLQDLVTLGYGIGGIVFLALFFNALRREFIKPDRVFYKLMASTAALFLISQAADSFDDLAIRSLRLPETVSGIPLEVIFNTFEEIFEFLGAMMFLGSFTVALLEFKDHMLLRSLVEIAGRKMISERARWRRGWATAAAAMTFMVIFIGVQLYSNASPRQAARATGDRPVSLFLGSRAGLRAPDGMAFDPRFGLCVGDEKGRKVVVFNSAGESRIWLSARDGLKSPEAVAWAPDGGLYVSDDEGCQIFRVSPAGDARVIASERDGLKSPEGIAIDRDGNLFIGDEKASAIFKLAANGKMSVFADATSGLTSPEELEFDREGNLFVTDDIGAKLFKFAPDGRGQIFATSSCGLKTPESIAIDKDGMIFVSDSGQGKIFRFTPDGTASVFAQFGREFRHIEGIAFNERGEMFVARPPYYVFKIGAAPR